MMAVPQCFWSMTKFRTSWNFMLLLITMYRKISCDMKITAIWLYEQELLALDDILDCCGFWYQILKLWRETGDIVPPNCSLRGHLHTLDHNNVQYLCQLIHQNPDYFLEELLYLLKTNHFISVNYITIYHELERTGVSCKKHKCIALKQNKPHQANFICCMAKYSPDEVGFLDEMLKDEREIGRRYGRSLRGTHAVKKQVSMQGCHTSMEALLSLDGIIVDMVVEGSMTKDLFLKYLENIVISLSWPYILEHMDS